MLAGLAFLRDDRDRMARLGIVLYWAATVIAVALVVLAVFAYFTATGSGALAGLGGLVDRYSPGERWYCGLGPHESLFPLRAAKHC